MNVMCIRCAINGATTTGGLCSICASGVRTYRVTQPDLTAALHARIAELEAENAKLTTERDEAQANVTRIVWLYRPFIDTGERETIDGRAWARCMCGWLEKLGENRCHNEAHQGNVQRAYEDQIERTSRERDTALARAAAAERSADEARKSASDFHRRAQALEGVGEHMVKLHKSFAVELELQVNAKHRFRAMWKGRYRAAAAQIVSAGVPDHVDDKPANYKEGRLDVLIARLIEQRDAARRAARGKAEPIDHVFHLGIDSAACGAKVDKCWLRVFPVNVDCVACLAAAAAPTETANAE